jgi:tRNA pseudouridine55 synthase
MTGASEQVPPMYSARKIGGQRLYAMARKGIEVAREPRPVFINAFRVTEYGDRSISFYIECSKGTYIRTVAHDLGQACGYGAYLSSLRRVAVDGFDVTNALTIDEFQHFWKALN